MKTTTYHIVGSLWSAVGYAGVLQVAGFLKEHVSAAAFLLKWPYITVSNMWSVGSPDKKL